MKPPKYSPNTIRSFALVVLISILLLGCNAQKKVPATITQDDGIITFKFIQLNDVYEIAPLSGGKYGGMARVAHVKDSIKAENPNTFMFMAGDFLNPSLLGTIKYGGERIRGKQMIEVMNAMGFELVVLGNHEFDVGREDFQKRLNESEFNWMATNVMEVLETGRRPFTIKRGIGDIPIPRYHKLAMSDADGTRLEVAFIGPTIPSNPRDWVYYEDIYKSAQSEALQLLGPNRTELLFGLTHLTLSQDKELAKRIADIPFIMGGHEHNSMLVKQGDAIIAKADANAKTIYIHTLTYNKNTKELDIDSHLMPIDEKIKSKPEVKAIVDRWNAILMKEIQKVVDDPNEVLFTANPPLDGTDSASRGIQTNLGGVITSAMAASFEAPVEAALVNGGSIRIDDMLPSEVTSMDIFRTLPFGGQIVKVELTGDLLLQVLDYGRSKRGTGAYLQRNNIAQNSEGAWELGGALVEADKTYTVAISDFLMKGLDIPFLTPENEGVLNVYEPSENEAASDVRKAVINYLRNLNE